MADRFVQVRFVHQAERAQRHPLGPLGAQRLLLGVAGRAVGVLDIGVLGEQPHRQPAPPTYLALGREVSGEHGEERHFASRSQHEAAVVGKEVVDVVYGERPAYSYFIGCSTGGRQGYMEAQRHPGDYDGILADAPAVNWDEFEVATLWPQVVMNNEKTYPSQCEFAAFTQAAVKACDSLDGVRDGLVDEAARCDYDPRRLVGTKVVCDGREN